METRPQNRLERPPVRATTRIGRTATLLALCGALGCGYFEPRGLANVSGLKRAAGSAPPAVTRIKTPAPRREPSPREIIDELLLLMKAVLDARGRVVLEMNIAQGSLDRLIDLLPAMKSPTVAKLYGTEHYAVKVAVPRARVARLVPELKRLGASDILETDIRKVIL